ncbi:MAG: orotate phosphoribosyltransferase [Rickettsiaceae bacterium H1]|nr:orotate phosphoribosyltransferase [Rickettsiaceae bacterium H1]
MKEKKIIEEFESCGAIKKGHFILSSGLHSDRYVQCAQLLKNPQKAKFIVQCLIEKIPLQIKSQVNLVVSPAMGGVTLGYEVAGQLGCKAIFCERVEGKFVFRRDFAINSDDKVLIIEDVVTTAKSSLEVIALINNFKCEILAEAALIDRSNGLAKQKLLCKFISLLEIDIKTYNKNNLPKNLMNVPVNILGSRFIKNQTDF